MTRIELPLSKLSTAQKLDLMEAIWADLCSREDTLESPDWHQPVLRERETSLSEGTEIVLDWTEAKKSIRKTVQ